METLSSALTGALAGTVGAEHVLTGDAAAGYAVDWTVALASTAADVVRAADPGARVITFGHVADGNVHVNIVPAAAADGRHEDAVFSFVASLGGSISAEHGIGALKAPWLHLARSSAERALFARLRKALDPAGTLNPHVLPRLPFD